MFAGISGYLRLFAGLVEKLFLRPGGRLAVFLLAVGATGGRILTLFLVGTGRAVPSLVAERSVRRRRTYWPGRAHRHLVRPLARAGTSQRCCPRTKIRDCARMRLRGMVGVRSGQETMRLVRICSPEMKIFLQATAVLAGLDGAAGRWRANTSPGGGDAGNSTRLEFRPSRNEHHCDAGDGGLRFRRHECVGRRSGDRACQAVAGSCTTRRPKCRVNRGISRRTPAVRFR